MSKGKEYELSGNFNEIMKQLKKILAKELIDQEFEIRATKEGVLLNGSYANLLYGLSGICNSLYKNGIERFDNKEVKKEILQAVNFGIETDDLLLRNPYKEKEEEDDE